jgi:threonine dehydrogenase-like Zn-dependent dehydrogenase
VYTPNKVGRTCRLFCIDHWPNRLSKTKKLGAEIINFDNVDPVEILKKETNNKGVICIDAVGYQDVGHMAGNICSREDDMLKVNNNNNNNKEDSKKKEGN